MLRPWQMLSREKRNTAKPCDKQEKKALAEFMVKLLFLKPPYTGHLQ